MTQEITAAQRLVETLVVNGITHVFCVPGESYLSVLDALYGARDKIKVVTCRHEAGAANMAVAYGKLTGKPGICMVTRGPGATHGSIGIHTAQQDSVPLIYFIGQVALSDKGREAFQEVDYGQAFGPLCKLALEVEDPARMVEVCTRAFAVAQQGRKGAVVIALPEDMLAEPAGARKPAPVKVAHSGLEPGFLDGLAARLEAAERPVLILGGTGWSDDSLAALSKWIEKLGVPVALSFRRKDLIDNTHPCYMGDLGLGPNPKLIQRVKSADLVVAIGARLGENPSQAYTLLAPEESAARLVHIHPDPEELNRVWPASLAAACETAAAALSLSKLAIRRSWANTPWATEGRADLEAFLAPVAVTGSVNLSEVFKHLEKTLPEAIVGNGAGNYAAWLHRFYRHRKFGTQLAPTSGAMGFGFPAAIAAKIMYPARTVVAVAGDGCFMMTSNELATAVQYDANLIIIVVDNGSYGTIRMHQEREYPERVSATNLKNPDFAAFARSFGAWATTIDRTEAFPAALEEAGKAGKPALIHIKTSVADIAPGRTIKA
ncbi:MAG: thiamine pyrophosphate-binding protein [Rhodospirillaceae bacterium]|nr:thiamine pyrophosphate-binding protein [Rhodospirillaceae bacterium]